jgi:hypothetical protein
MYRKMLAVHLCTALFCLSFLAMYGVSAVQLAHRTWIRVNDDVTETHLALPPGLAGARAVASELMLRHGIDGELVTVFETPAGVNFRIQRPGTLFQMRYQPAGGETAVIVRRGGIGRVLNALHGAAGMWHGFAPMNAWAAVLGLVSLGLLLLGATGFYLWLRNPKERVAGILLLTGGAAVALTLIVSMRLG